MAVPMDGTFLIRVFVCVWAVERPDFFCCNELTCGARQRLLCRNGGLLWRLQGQLMR